MAGWYQRSRDAATIALNVDARGRPGHENRETARRGPWAAAAGHSTFLIQLCGSLVRPYWMSTSFLRMPMATGPAAPPEIRKSPFTEHTLPIGEITAAVPQAKASFSLPLAASARHCSML